MRRVPPADRAERAIITLTTDFGLEDGFVGVMKGVIWAICPGAQIADLSHAIPPQDIPAASRLLRRAAAFFPPGTVHLAVVDPGVGTARRPLAARIGAHFFVAPDNGLLTPWINLAESAGETPEIVQLDNPRTWLATVSRTFHGRDMFAPAAAYLACGVALAELGTAISDPVRIPFSTPEQTAEGWRAHVTAIDHFGNLATDLQAEVLNGAGAVRIRVAGREIAGLVAAYGERPAGELVALVDSAGTLEIAVVNGSAARLLGAQAGDSVEVLVAGRDKEVK